MSRLWNVARLLLGAFLVPWAVSVFIFVYTQMDPPRFTIPFLEQYLKLIPVWQNEDHAYGGNRWLLWSGLPIASFFAIFSLRISGRRLERLNFYALGFVALIASACNRFSSSIQYTNVHVLSRSLLWMLIGVMFFWITSPKLRDERIGNGN